jgi:hypothetical protein
MDLNVAGRIRGESHLHGAPHLEKLLLGKRLHLWDDDDDIGSPEAIQGIDIAVQVRLVPDRLEPKNLLIAALLHGLGILGEKS